MSPRKRRLVLYGLGSCLAGALIFVGFVVKLPPDIDQLLSNAAFQTQMGAIGGAREQLAQVLLREPENWKALWMDGYCAEREGKPQEAISRYRAATAGKIEPKHREEIQAAILRLEEAASPSEKPKSP